MKTVLMYIREVDKTSQGKNTRDFWRGLLKGVGPGVQNVYIVCIMLVYYVNHYSKGAFHTTTTLCFEDSCQRNIFCYQSYQIVIGSCSIGLSKYLDCYITTASPPLLSQATPALSRPWLILYL